MTTPDPVDDAVLDQRIRAASLVPFDDIAVTETVLARVQRSRPARPAPQRSGWTGWIGPTAFASLLVATPFVVAFYPASDDALLVGLATGDLRAILGGAGEGPFAGFGGAFE